MTHDYQVPKREISAEVTVSGRPAAPVRLFLADQAERHSGPERPSDLLNGEGAFIPARNEDGELMLLQRDAVSVLSVPAEYEFGDEDEYGAEPPSGATRHDLSVELEDGTQVTGEVIYVRPEGQRRLQDYLNDTELFFGIYESGTVHLVNRRRILWASLGEART